MSHFKMNVFTTIAILGASLSFCAFCHAAIIDTVPIGNPGNPAAPFFPRPNGVGSVDYSFRMAKTEVTNAQYVAFLNAVAAGDPHGLYQTSMGDTTWGGIVRSGTPGSYTYAVKPAALNGTYAYGNKPVVWLEPGDALRFANWLHNGQPTGPQSASTTEDGAYTLNGATSPVDLPAVTRNPGARWWLPSEDEWYKAAYHKNDGVTGNYWGWPTGHPGAIAPNNSPPSSDTGNSANFLWNGNSTTGNLDYPLTDAGAYTLSASAYGTFDQGGNVQEFTDTLIDIGIFGSHRVARGGSWANQIEYLSPGTLSGGVWPQADGGFRVATSIPEPGSLPLGAMAVIGMLWRGHKSAPAARCLRRR
jgi:formylglycine-generating enzyme